MSRGENPNVYNYTFVHNVFAHFFKDSLDYFSAYLYPRFEWTVMGTYEKAVEYITKTNDDLGAGAGSEVDKPNVPALILNPSGEFNLDEAGHGARQLYRFPNLAPGLAFRVFDHIYQDENMTVTPSFTRVRGEMELIMLCASFYEYCDLRLYLIQIFGGTDRPIDPQFFNSFIILPPELVNYQYTNEYTGANYQMDWATAGAGNYLVETTNKDEIVFPCRIKPRFKLTAITDGSTRYGGTDSLAEWKLVATVEYEVEIPTFLIFKSDYLAENISLQVGYGSNYSEYPAYNTDHPTNLNPLNRYHWDSGLTQTPLEDGEEKPPLPDESDIVSSDDIKFQRRYYHKYTQAQADSEVNFIIDLPESITKPEWTIIMSQYGKMDYNDHYKFVNSNTGIEIQVEFVDVNVDEFIEIYIYG